MDLDYFQESLTRQVARESELLDRLLTRDLSPDNKLDGRLELLEVQRSQDVIRRLLKRAKDAGYETR